MDNNSLVMSSNIDQHLNKERISNMLTIADQFHKAQCFTKDVQNVFQAFAKIQAGAEMGMSPMESMTGLYIVNGNVTMWGKATTQRLRQFGWQISYDESVPDECTATITKNSVLGKGETYSYTSTKAELIALKSRAASFALRDKLKWHAISRICRFYVPEVLGSVAYVKEEVEDLPEFSAKSIAPTATNLDMIETVVVSPENKKEEEKPKVTLGELKPKATMQTQIEMATEVFAENPTTGQSEAVATQPKVEKKIAPMKPFVEFAGEVTNQVPKTHREKMIEVLMEELEKKPTFNAQQILDYFMVDSLGALLEGQVEYAINWVKK